MIQQKMFTTGAVLMVIAVILGALAAHALEKQLTVDSLESFKTGVRYQVYHALALILIAHTTFIPDSAHKIVFYLFLSGTLLFSFSIYALVCGPLAGLNLRFLGPVTPVGGLLLIAGWVYVVIKSISSGGMPA